MKFLNFFYFSGSFLPSWIRIQKSMRIHADPVYWYFSVRGWVWSVELEGAGVWQGGDIQGLAGNAGDLELLFC
jgi:hypothetical protein